MCATNDLRAQAGATSRDVMPVMGGVVFGVGSLCLTAAIAVGLDRHEIEPTRVVALLSMLLVIIGGFIWSHASLRRRIQRVEAGSRLEVPSVNGHGNIASIDSARY